MADAPGAMSAPTPVRARLDGVPRRLPKGASDRIALTGGKCACDRSEGTIVLFYAYVPIEDPCSLVARLRDVCGTHGVTGKLRIGREGINGTAAGSHAGIEAMRAELASESSHEPSLAAAAGGMDYKPAPGCACLFDDLSVRLVTEIVPFEPSSNGAGGGGGRKAKAAKKKKGRHAVLGGDDDNNGGDDTRTEHRVPPPCPVGYMDPKEFHDAVVCKDNDTIVLDVRNWYESRVGHFEGAVLAPIRRFSQLPEYVQRNKSVFHGKDVLMYCTGGIRCEKAAKYLASFGEVEGGEGDRDGGNQNTKKSEAAVTGRPRSVRQLRGGIVAYARDVLGSAGDVDVGDVDVGADQGAELGAELKSNVHAKSAYLGKNFVFDNRGATRVSGDVVSWCDGCGVRSDRLGKCGSVGCHVILIVCEKCGGKCGGEVFCCGKCESQEVARVATPDGKRKRMPCDCDGYEARERRLLPTPTPR